MSLLTRVVWLTGDRFLKRLPRALWFQGVVVLLPPGTAVAGPGSDA